MCLHGMKILNFHGIRTHDVASECLVGREKVGISVNVLRREEMKEEQKSSSYFFRLDFEIEMTQNIISRLMHFRPSTEDNSTEKYEIKQFLSSSRSRQNDWRSDEPSWKVLGSNPVPATFLTPRIYGPEHLSLKLQIVEFDFDVSVCNCVLSTDTWKSNLRPYNSVQMSIRSKVSMNCWLGVH